MNTDLVIGCFDAFSQTLKRQTVVVLDNASIHRASAFQTRMPIWEAKGLILYFLPAYAPELNLIEIVWRFIKYLWLPFAAYVSFDALRTAVEAILTRFGQDYKINW